MRCRNHAQRQKLGQHLRIQLVRLASALGDYPQLLGMSQHHTVRLDPLPGGKLVFVSNCNAFRPPKHPSPTLQLFVMDEDGGNVECIGHLNIGMALHPTVLTDGRVMFSSLESQGLRGSTL